MTLCHCQKEVQYGPERNLALTDLEQKVLLLDLNNMQDVQNSLKDCCIRCIKSMLHDTNMELAAREPTREAKLMKQFQEVLPGSDEYKLASDRFLDSMGSYNIVRIEKNYNPDLFSEYTGQKVGEERLMFHGSANGNYIKILTCGFDLSKSRNGLLGHGVYFAQNASYSHGFTRSLIVKDAVDETMQEDEVNPYQVYNMLLCRVSVGAARHGDSILCVPNDRHCYPEYIIYYTTNKV